MKKYVIASLMILALVFMIPALSQAAGNAAGKKAFLDNKCHKCHAMKSEGIAQLPKTAEADEEAEEEEGEKVDPPDLSKLSDNLLKAAATPDEALRKWLKKEVSVTYKDKPRKHKKQYNGADADLNTIIQFLQGK